MACQSRPRELATRGRCAHFVDKSLQAAALAVSRPSGKKQQREMRQSPLSLLADERVRGPVGVREFFATHGRDVCSSWLSLWQCQHLCTCTVLSPERWIASTEIWESTYSCFENYKLSLCAAGVPLISCWIDSFS